MIVNELARDAGVSSNTVRYYTKIGLLEPARDPNNGYKMYPPDDIHKLKFILQAKNLGFTLAHIKALLDRVKRGESVCALVREQTEINIEACEEEIVKLTKLKRRMEAALVKWQKLPNVEPTKNIWCHLIEPPS